MKSEISIHSDAVRDYAEQGNYRNREKCDAQKDGVISSMVVGGIRSSFDSVYIEIYCLEGYNLIAPIGLPID